MSLNLQTTTAVIDENGELRGLEPLPMLRSQRVQVVIVSQVEEETELDYNASEITPQEWQAALNHNPVFAFLADEAEDIYSWEDGEPIEKEATKKIVDSRSSTS